MQINKYAGKVLYFILLSLIFGIVYFLIDKLGSEDNFNGLEKDKTTFLDYWYFSFTTFSTVGYGDISPKTALAKIIVVFQQVILLLELTDDFLGLIGIKLDDVEVSKTLNELQPEYSSRRYNNRV